MRALMVVAIALLCAALSYAEQARDRDATWSAPSDAVSKQNPIEGRTDVVSGGRKIFHQRCATCHNEDGRGTTRAPDLTDSAVQEQSDGALFWKITVGNSHVGMPSFSFLPELQRWQLVLALRDVARFTH
jgi:mono/diheme cytochrome c family protein